MLYTEGRKIVFCFLMKRVGKINNSTFCVKISVIERIFFKCDEKSNQDMAPTYLGFFQETWIFLKKSWQRFSEMQYFRNRLNDKMLLGGGGTKKTVPPIFIGSCHQKIFLNFVLVKK